MNDSNKPDRTTTRQPAALLAVVAVIASILAVATVGTVGAQSSDQIYSLSASNVSNSATAWRLTDGTLGTDDNASWENPNPWNAGNYPMIAEISLGGTFQLSSLRYYVGNLTQGNDDVLFEYSTTASGDDFQWLTRQNSGHQWGEWASVQLNGQWAQRVRVIFLEQNDRFNIGELQLFGTEVGQPTTSTAAPTTTTSTTAPTSTTSTSVPVATTTTTAPTTTTTTTVPGTGQTGDLPRSAVPGPNIVRAHGFGTWPSSHLSDSCRDLHDRYWVQGQNAGISADPTHPDNRAYHTWHPAIDVHPETGEVCDYGHEHGTSPLLAPADVFELSGGWPAFGYAAAQAGTDRHEDHFGHKVTVARFAAAIGNGAGDETLYDAGFECNWLSKLHQGSHSLDAFANHLHEYFLTIQCFDGKNAQGVRTGNIVGTEFSVKLLYTYGRPNRFIEENCAEARDFDVSVLRGPNGETLDRASVEAPVTNAAVPNDRAFVCSNALQWRSLDQRSEHAVAYTDIWTDFVEISNPNGDGVIQIQPYYLVKNASRIIEGFENGGDPSQVMRTIDLCYGADGQKLNLRYCEEAPATNPGWNSPLSPFNGALRAVHFKAVTLNNEGGAAVFCTNAFGRQVDDELPCDRGNIEQRAASYTNDFNNGRFSRNGRSGNVAGSIWAEIPGGERTTTRSLGGGAYESNGIGFEFIIDNRNPDDNGDGQPDGANLRGQN